MRRSIHINGLLLSCLLAYLNSDMSVFCQADADAATDIADLDTLYTALRGVQIRGRADLRPGTDDDTVGAAIGSR